MTQTVDRRGVTALPEQGLTASDAAERLRQDGKNELPQ